MFILVGLIGLDCLNGGYFVFLFHTHIHISSASFKGMDSGFLFFVFLFFWLLFFFFPVSLSCCLDNWPRRSVHVHVIVINPDFNL